MEKIRRLIDAYAKHIAIPWPTEVAPTQRFIFCVYNENDERHLCVKIDEFELATPVSPGGWALFVLTHTFAQWMAI